MRDFSTLGIYLEMKSVYATKIKFKQSLQMAASVFTQPQRLQQRLQQPPEERPL